MNSQQDVPLTVEYISTACNRSPLCADWNSKNLLCFGACNSVALLDTEFNDSAKIICTLVNHKASVNSVRWIRSNEDDTNNIISGSSDGTAVIWKYIENNYCPVHCLRDHHGSVTVVDARFIKEDNAVSLYAVTASVDSSVKIWKENSDDMACIQSIDLNGGLCLVLQLHVLPTTNTSILALGLDDNKVHLYVRTLDNTYEKKFIKVLVLKGHEDWIRCLDFITLDNKLMLATCSQDTYIRLWSIEPFKEKQIIDDKLEIKREFFSVDDRKWSISLETILSGHEGWVYGVNWNNNKTLKLLSASIDKSLIIWEPNIIDGKEGVWSETIRVGEVGGSGLGFYGGKFSHDGQAIIAHGYTGSFHLWKYKKELSSWEPSVVSGGHFAAVMDIGWDPDGEYLISASCDQTVRIHSSWVKNNSSQTTWHEIARPQIHGFDMSCLAIISKYSYASGAEEKVIRTFQAPKNFIDNFHQITGYSNEITLNNVCQGASISSLGLSNKAIYTVEDVPSAQKHVKDQYPTHYFVPVQLNEPPTEETLMQNTLWPETHKLYGHGYEVFTLAASPDGKLLASACKATSPQHASIIIWDVDSWTQKQTLTSHQLTVVQMEFSPDSSMLLSVSRDRRWSVFQKVDNGTFTLIGSSDKSNGIHTRIIWCCAWTHNSKHFLTGSRDGKVAVWEKGESDSTKSTGAFFSSIPPLELKSQSVTALATAPTEDGIVVAVGLETGIITIYRISYTNKHWELLLSLNNNVSHHLAVKRLYFRPTKNYKNKLLQLASCSEDHTVKIFNFKL